MRIKNDFSLYVRKAASGKAVYYYQCYDGNGRRLCGHSTGETTRTGAMKKCIALIREGKLLPEKQMKVPTFEEFARDFWDWEKSLYLKSRRGRRDITQTYAAKNKNFCDNQILPFFGKMLIDQISEHDIDSWLLGFTERERSRANKLKAGTEGEKKGYSPVYANNVLTVLNIMLGEAVKRKILKSNPAAGIQKLKVERREKEIITPAEIRKLFTKDWETVWESDLVCKANKLAACTGMRIGEVLGLRGENVFEEYIHVGGQFHEKFGYGPTKTKEKRNIPIAPVIREDLKTLAERNGSGYLFSEDGGQAPLKRINVYTGLMRALANIGIDRDEARRRGLNLHAWRHFFNTTLRMANVMDSKVQSITGHKTIAMTERYTHFDAKEFVEVKGIQETLLLCETGEPPETGSASEPAQA
jgi:integrase